MEDLLVNVIFTSIRVNLVLFLMLKFEQNTLSSVNSHLFSSKWKKKKLNRSKECYETDQPKSIVFFLLRGGFLKVDKLHKKFSI